MEDKYLDKTGLAYFWGKIKSYFQSNLPSVPSPADATPLMDGASSVGSSSDYAREDHVHPTDTSRAADNSVVHKTGNESISGAKTFNGGVMVGLGSQLKFETAQEEGTYIEAGDNNGVKTLMFADIEDDSTVRLENIANPSAGTDAANKAYVDGLLNDNNAVYLNGRSFSSGIQPWSLCAFSLSVGGTVMYMTSFTGTGGDGGGAPLTSVQFPIGCKIYYHPSETAVSANTEFTSKKFHTTFKEVDGRYSSVTGSSLNLNSQNTGSTSTIYLHVLIDGEYWKPYYKTGATNEIIVSSNQLQSGNFYIYLGKKIGVDAYTFQLEDNNPLYFYDGTNLIDWASYQANKSATTYTAGDGIIIDNNHEISVNIPYKKETFSSSSFNVNSSYSKGLQNYTTNLSVGTYKVTLQVHLYIVSNTNNMMPAGCVVNVCMRNKRTTSSSYQYILGATETLSDGTLPETDISTGKGIISKTLNVVGFMEVTGEEDSGSSLEAIFTTNSSLNVLIGNPVPRDGTYDGLCSGNDFVLLEKIA